MFWKGWYRDEAASPAGRAAIGSALDACPEGDPTIRGVLREGGAASFPHTTLLDSAAPLARVATSILAEGLPRVVALGVLHGSVAPEPARGRLAAANGGDAAALLEVGGAFVAEPEGVRIPTLSGPIVAGPVPVPSAFVRLDPHLLANEFSLDLFLEVLAAAARARGRPPPTVTRVFVGPVGDPGAARDERPVVRAVADAVSPLLGPDVALVATGDLAHAGHGYSTPAETDGLPRDAAGLSSLFEVRVRAMLDAAMAGGVASGAADAIAREVRSDMRNVLPVLGALLGPAARARVLSFRLSDYGPILDEPPPCVVASALVAFERGAA